VLSGIENASLFCDMQEWLKQGLPHFSVRLVGRTNVLVVNEITFFHNHDLGGEYFHVILSVVLEKWKS
jgi:hypothetical protein